jgi:AhpD family alkylhydroperoxidase
MQKLRAAARGPGVPATNAGLVDVRASQIDGCSVCLDLHSRELKAAVSDERIFMVGASREAPYFEDAERAPLALAESATPLADSADPVPDEVWEQAVSHPVETQLAGLVMAIATISAFNRLNAATSSGDRITQHIEPTEPVSKAA